MKKFRKLAASVAAITTALSLSVGTLAVTANEVKKAIDTKAEYTLAEKQFIDSYSKKGEEKAAKFLVDNGIELTEAKRMVDMYIEGKQLRDEQDSVKASKKGSKSYSKYYSETHLSGQQHYGVIVYKGYATGTYSPYFNIGYNTGYHNMSFPLYIKYWAPNYAVNYVGTNNPIGMSFNFTPSESPEAFLDFEFGIGSSATSEYDVYNAFSFSNTNYSDLFEYETYIQGDINHDGWVNSIDYSYIFEYNVLQADEGDLESYYSDNNSNVKAPVPAIAHLINVLASDLDKDGGVGVSDLVMISQPAYRDDLPNI
jgi:uncharacterized membrane protein